MTAPDIDVVGVGNAIVDVLAHADDAFLEAESLDKGTMTLIDESTADRLYTRMGPGVEVSGGSAANTIACIASLGGTGAFVGKVRDDQLGTIFRHDIQSLGITYETLPAGSGAATARCLVFVTPDAQRTMQTFLGAAAGLAPDDIDDDLIARSKITYLEGYLWDPPPAKEAFIRASKAAHAAGRRVALNLSDPFCVDRHRDGFIGLINDHVDILIANEDEIVSLYQVHAFDDAMHRVRGHCSIAVLTRSDKGAVILSENDVHIVDAEQVDNVVDTTGAGDAYAAGFLYGLTHQYPLATCGRIGSIAAAEVISHVGARPEVPLAELLKLKLP